jgi:hypothetical protein
MTIDQVLDMLRSRVKDYKEPGRYMEEEWYVKCAAKVEVLEDVISDIEYRIKKEDKK